jgi:WD40 repeat protein
MAHVVYVSYSTQDKTVADAVCATLENNKFDCWMSPRDIPPGQPYAAAITNAIRDSQVFVLILSESSNQSAHVLREVGEAITERIPIIPFRIDDVEPTGDLRHFIMSIFWLDAFTPPLDQHLERLTSAVQGLFASSEEAQEAPLPAQVDPVFTEEQKYASSRTQFSAEQQSILNAFSRALLRETHVLKDRPDLLWQQLYNRLQWENETVVGLVTAEREQRSVPGEKPWIRTRVPFQESKALVRTLTGHTADVYDCAFSPDGKLIVSSSRDTTLKVWDAATGDERATLIGHRGGVNGCAFSPDGSLIVSASEDKTLKVWDAASGCELRTLTGHAGWVYGCAFSPDGTLIVSTSRDHTLKVWNAINGSEPRTLTGHSESVNGCVFSLDGSLIVSASDDKTLKVWDVDSGHELHTITGHKDRVTACAFSPDGGLILSASADKMLKVWDADSGRELRTLIGHDGWVSGCAFNPDGTLIVSAGMDFTLKVWDAASGREHPTWGRELRTWTGHSIDVNGCAFSPDGSLIVSASADYTLKVWDAASGHGLSTWTRHQYDVRDCTFSPDGSLIVSTGDITVIVSNAASGRKMRTLNGHTKFVTGCAFSPDGNLIVSASADKTLKVWDAASGRELHTWTGHTESVNGCAFSPDGSLIVSASADKTLKVWDSDSGRELRTLTGHTDDVNHCAFSPDGSLIVSASDDKTLKVWDAASGRELKTLTGHRWIVKGCAFSPDGSLIVSASYDNTLKVWDGASGHELRTLAGHTDFVSNCAFSPDGSLIVSASDDNTLKVWGAASGRELSCIPLLGSALSVGLHPWKMIAASGDQGGFIYLLDLRGIDYGPILVTPAKCSQGLVVRCPSCRRDHTVTKLHLGTELTCPTPDCGLHMKLNPFLVVDRWKEITPPPEVDDFRRKGEELLNSGKLGEAADCFARGLKLHPDDLTLLDLHARTLLKQGYIQAGCDIIDHMIDKGLASGDCLGKLYGAVGFALGVMGGEALENALIFYQMASDLVTDDWEIWYYQGLANYRMGYYEDALDCLQRAKEIDDNQETILLINSCYEEMEDYSEEE